MEVVVVVVVKVTVNPSLVLSAWIRHILLYTDCSDYLLAECSALFGLEVFPQWVSIVTVYINLCKHIKLHTEIVYHILLNFLIWPRFLQATITTNTLYEKHSEQAMYCRLSSWQVLYSCIENHISKGLQQAAMLCDVKVLSRGTLHYWGTGTNWPPSECDGDWNVILTVGTVSHTEVQPDTSSLVLRGNYGH